MTHQFFQEIQAELQQGAIDNGHPFKFCTMATVGLDRVARLRTVRLRSVTEDMELTFFTDKRSKKIIHIKENKNVSLLFYHPEKLLQIRIEGIALIVKDKLLLNKYWQKVQPEQRRDYTTSLAPGSKLADPDAVEYLHDEEHFCALAIRPFKFEYLQLKRPNHLRVRYSLESYGWESEYLVP